MYRAKDVLNSDVITVSLEMSVEDAIQVLLENRISGAPVTDSEGVVHGIISEYQLLEVIFTPDLKSSPVTKFMTTDVLTVNEDSPLTEIASQFVLLRIRRLPVVRDGKLIGVISRRDLLRHGTQNSDAAGKLVAESQKS